MYFSDVTSSQFSDVAHTDLLTCLRKGIRYYYLHTSVLQLYMKKEKVKFYDECANFKFPFVSMYPDQV